VLIPRLLRRILLIAALGVVALAGAAVLIAWAAMARSLPTLDGEATLSGLADPVRIERDDVGAPRIRAASRTDAMRALGFLHAQDRYFQMDLLRRRAAGELAALVGPAALPSDRRMRKLLLRDRAERALDAMPESRRRTLDAYTEGVNTGLDALDARPPEYFLLRNTPDRWSPTDTLLVALAMYDNLNFSVDPELMKSVMAASLPETLVDFLTQDTTRWDALLIGDSSHQPAEIPGPRVIDLRAPRPNQASAETSDLDLVSSDGNWRAALGSNGWAVAGNRTSHGGALLANDMHLGLQIPNIWYRAQVEYGDRRLVGATLPGVPGFIVGSNGHVAWGFTNTTGDFEDLVRIDVVGEDDESYVASESPRRIEPFDIRTETIKVKGADDVQLEVPVTEWGPVIGEDPLARPLALAWTAHRDEGFDLSLLDMADATTLEQAVEVAENWRGPSQNAMIAAGDGRIAWVVTGLLPNRIGFDGSVSVNWATPGVGWDGALDPLLRPMRVDPAEGLLFTANARTTPVEIARRISTEWAPPFRQARIGSVLRSSESVAERDMLDLQLDTHDPLLGFYRDRVLEVTTDNETAASMATARRIATAWSGNATLDERAHRLLDLYRRIIHRRVFSPLVAPCRELDSSFQYTWLLSEEPLRRILEERPMHLLSPKHDTWDGLLREALEETVRTMQSQRPDLPIDARWGEVSRVRIGHPASRAVGTLGWLLDMKSAPLPGDTHTVRVTHPQFGVSQRLVVSPGREESAIWHMPGGQSGHFLSPFYGKGHEAWVEGRPTPLLVGRTKHTLILRPAAESPRSSP